MTSLQNLESDILETLATVKKDLTIAESDVGTLFAKIATNAPAITVDLADLSAMLAATPLGSNPIVGIVLAAVNAAVETIADAGVTATVPQTILALYTGIKTAIAKL
jgi:hypothetical protein